MHFLVLSGILRNAADLKDAAKLAVRAVLPPEVVASFSDRLDAPTGVPARSTLYRHRLTLHAAWTVLSQSGHVNVCLAPRASSDGQAQTRLRKGALIG